MMNLLSSRHKFGSTQDNSTCPRAANDRHYYRQRVVRAVLCFILTTSQAISVTNRILCSIVLREHDYVIESSRSMEGRYSGEKLIKRPETDQKAAVLVRNTVMC